MTLDMSRKKKLRDYEELLDFARQELREDQIRLISARSHEENQETIQQLEGDIETLKKAVDRFQMKIKILKNAIQESEDH